MLSLYDNIIYGEMNMKNLFAIKKIAKERAVTLMSIAKKLGIYRSNMSAIASGKRGVSLDMLIKIGHILDCGLDELVTLSGRSSVFKNKNIEDKLNKIIEANYDGMDKTWVNNIVLAGLRHYGNAKRTTK